MGRLEHYLPEWLIVAVLGGATAATVLMFARWGITPYFAIPWDLATLASVGIYFAVRRSHRDPSTVLRELVLIGVGIALVNIFIGLGNPATDEGYTTPLYANQMLAGINPYTHHLTVQYNIQVLLTYHYAVTSVSYDTYLPLISFVQIPGTGVVGYELLCVAAWLGMVYLLRKDPFASLVLASPAVALLASNGFNDLPLLFLMTLSLRGWTGPKSKAVEYLTYGMKQFANAFWLILYLVRRQWVSAALVVVITIAWVTPFLLWQPGGVYCQALTFGWGPGCSAASTGARGIADLWDHWNYYLWPVWIYALFHGTIDRWLARVFGRSSPALASPSSDLPRSN